LTALKVDNQEASTLKPLQQVEILRQSILKKAFSGQLVPQDPNDEPVPVLLDLIHTKKEAQTNAG
jgi:type I restriction enzyme S subunit